MNEHQRWFWRMNSDERHNRGQDGDGCFFRWMQQKLGKRGMRAFQFENAMKLIEEGYGSLIKNGVRP